MAYGTKPFLLAQSAAETTPGTAVTPTSIWRGIFPAFKDDRIRNTTEEDIGQLGQVGRIFDAFLGGSFSVPATPVTFEQVCYLFEAGINAVAPTGAGPYVRTYALPTGSTLNTPKTRTWVVGNKQVTTDVKRLPYSFPTEIILEGKQKESWMMSSTWKAQKIENGTFAVLTLPTTLDEAEFSNTKLYIDASGGTIGTTQINGVLQQAQIRIQTGIVSVDIGDGDLFFKYHKFKTPVVTFSYTLELETTSVVVNERTAYDNKAFRLVRLECAGAAARLMRLDFAAKYLSVGEYDEADDEDIVVPFEGQAFVSTADNLWFTAAITNTLATLP